jgi:MFS family permease
MFTFVLLDIQSIAYQGYTQELHLSYQILNDASAANFAGLAFGCVLFIPLAHKYGRRPLYILSSVVQLSMAIWSGKLVTGGDLIAVNLIMGLGGAISEAIVMITIVDMFFVHQHARMNGIFLFMQTLGSTGGPIAAGYITTSQGWRWIWWWIAIFLGANFVAVLCFFEESKYMPNIIGQGLAGQNNRSYDGMGAPKTNEKLEEKYTQPISTGSTMSPRYLKKPLSRRPAFVTKTDIPIKQHFYQPLLVLISFPAITFTALTYGMLLAWFSIIASASAYFLLDPPYNFSPADVGLFHLAGFIGATLGALVGSPLSDWSAVHLARRNGGIFEPEMRLWLSFPGSLSTCAGLLVFGIGLGGVKFIPNVPGIKMKSV